MVEGHVERRLQIDAPLLRAQTTERLDERAAQQGLAAAEANAAARSLEVEVVDHRILQQPGLVHRAPDGVSIPALLVDTVLTAQRTAMKTHQRGDSGSVDAQPVATDGKKRYFHSAKIQNIY